MLDPSETTPYHNTPEPAGPRFAPGEVLAGRYRVVAPLGRGGMGEVYRADDLTLGQPVALKFLPEHLATDPGRLARFRQEVAVARRISHPNVCRVYDIAEHAGQSFLTMEYVDGEDLRSLLARVGRVPEEKGVEIARELGAALGAVHDQGLLHRDLKPANVMLDGRGRVRLTDFGLSAAAGDRADVRAGTPLYQAPEQRAGADVSARSDVYAFGLVLYELFTGRRAFATPDHAHPPSKPSSHVTGLDPAVERAILRCLEADPADRPKSAAEVLATLPGADPLAAALARGETPSPRVVAAAGGTGAVGGRVALLGVGVVAASLLVQAVAGDRAGLHRRAGIDAPPAAMVGKARQVLAGLGHPDPPADAVGRYEPNRDWIVRAARTDPDWARHAAGRPGAFRFFYREGPGPMVPSPSAEIRHPVPEVTWTNPPLTTPGGAAVRLDARGRLVEFQAAPPAWPDGDPTGPGDGWADPLFRAAGLDRARFTPTDPTRVPPGPCDRQAAWAGTWGDGSVAAVRVEASAYRGRPVWFRVEDGPPPAGPDPPGPIPTWNWGVFVAVVAVAGGLAVRNLRRGRGDRATAGRLWLALAGWVVLCALVAGHHGSAAGAVFWVQYALQDGALYGGFVVLLYLALEPAVRRRWPWRLTGWARLFAGRWRDPMVGRDLLVGMALGAVAAGLFAAYDWLGPAAGGPGPVRVAAGDGWAVPPVPLAHWLISLSTVLIAPTYQLFVAFCLFLVVRREALVWPAYMALYALSASLGAAHLTPGAAAVYLAEVGVQAGVFAFLLARFGLLAVAGAVFVRNMVAAVPFTLDPAAWYFPQAAVGAGVVLAAAGLCAWTAAGARLPSVGRLLGDE